LRKPFYGWIIVGVTFLIGITESSAVQSMLSVFMKPMVQDFGWSRTAVTGAIAFGSLLGGMLSPFVGPILDRHGPRMVAFWSILILSAGLICTAFSSSIWQFYLFFGVGRMIAVGILSLVLSVTVSKWFVRKRGRALGIAWLGPRFGSILLPVLCQFIILTLGWRMAWGILGVIVFLISGIPALLYLKRRPEDIGLLPDGAPPDSEMNECEGSLIEIGSQSSGKISEPVWTRALALRTKAFWALTFIHGMITCAQAGISFHIFPYLTDKGMNGMTAVWVLSTTAAFGALGSVVWGFFADKVRIQRLLAINAFTSGLVFFLLFWAIDFKVPHTLGVFIIFTLAAVFGILQGGRHPVLDTMWPVFFGRTSLGSIFSVSTPFRFAANALGPVSAALFFDMFGSYTFPFYLFCAIFFLVGIMSLFIKSPRHPLSDNRTDGYD
jgi:MFS family permease